MTRRTRLGVVGTVGLLACALLGVMGLAADAAPAPAGPPVTAQVEKAAGLFKAMGPPLDAAAGAIQVLQSGGQSAQAIAALRAPANQLAAITGALGNLLRKSPAAARDPKVREALTETLGRGRVTRRAADQPPPDIGALREPLVPALQFFCPGFYTVGGLVLGSVPPVLPSDSSSGVADLLCKNLPPPPGEAGAPNGASGDLVYYDVRSTGELLRFGAQSAFLPGTPLVDQGLGLTAAAADSNGSSAFAANLYPGSLVEAVPGAVALLGFPLTLPPLYPYIARAANPGPVSADASIVPSQTAAAYTFDSLSSKASAPEPNRSRAEAATTKVSQPGLLEVAAADSTSFVQPVEGAMASTSTTRIQGVNIASGFISIGEFVSNLTVTNAGASVPARVDRSVSLSGVKVLGIPVGVTDKGLVVSTVGADPGLDNARKQLAELVNRFQLELQVLQPTTSETESAGGKVVEAANPGLRISYRVPKEVSGVPLPVAQALLNNAKAEFKLGYTATFSSVTTAETTGRLGGSGHDPAPDASGSAATTSDASAPLSVPVEVTNDPAGPLDRAPADNTAGLEFAEGSDSIGGSHAPGVAGGPVGGVANLGHARETVRLASPAAFFSLDSKKDRRNAYLFSVILICVALAIIGWRTVLYNPGPPRKSARPPGDGDGEAGTGAGGAAT